MFKLKLIIAFLVVLLIAVLFGIGAAFYNGWITLPSAEGKERIHNIVGEYFKVAKMISLEYKYTDIYENKESSVPIPGFGDKRVLIRVRGTIFLGIDCNDIAMDTTRTDTLFLNMPPITMLAHDYHVEDTDIFDLSGAFRKYTVKDIQVMISKIKQDIEYNVMTDQKGIDLAQTAMEEAFNGLPLKGIPVKFLWDMPAAPPIYIPDPHKRETPINGVWGIAYRNSQKIKR